MSATLREHGVAFPAPRRPVDPDLRPSIWRGCRLAVLVHVGARVLDLVVLFLLGILSNEAAYKSLQRWDAHWYRRIAEHGYGFSHVVPDGRSLSDYAFFPLYPALERVISDLTGLRIMDAGLVISAISSVAAAAGIFMVGQTVLGRRKSIVLVLLWSTLPISIVQSMAYTESLFTALVAWCLYATLRRDFVVAGVLAAFAGLTRPTGGAVVVAVMVAAVLQLRSEIRSRSALAAHEDRARAPSAGPVLGALIAPLGMLAYLTYVGVREHDAFAYFTVARQWGNGVDGAVSFVTWTGRMLWGPGFLGGLLLSGALVLLGVLLYRMVREDYPSPLLIYTFLAVLLALSTSGYFGSKPRYLLPVFPLLMPITGSLGRMSTARLVVVSIGLAVVSSVYGAIWLFGPGPP